MNNTHDVLSSTFLWQPFVMPVSQTLSTQANPDASEVMMKQTSKSFFETPQRSHQTATNFDKVHQVHDFSTGAQQVRQILNFFKHVDINVCFFWNPVL